jgi:hypothetical protein
MYKVAIPSYNRSDIIEKKTLNALKKGNVKSENIYIFVANEKERNIYEESVNKKLYNKIIVGKKGIRNQRKFISNYFNEGENIVSLDDDIEYLTKRVDNSTLKKEVNLDKFFKNAFKLLKENDLYLWGIYPVTNPLFMRNGPEVSKDLRFIIGVMHGYIVRKDKDLQVNNSTSTKEDYEQTILYYLKDGGVLRFNRYAPKTKYYANGGLGLAKERIKLNNKAVDYLQKHYSNFVKMVKDRNGLKQIMLKDKSNKKTLKNVGKSEKNKTRKNRTIV